MSFFKEFDPTILELLILLNTAILLYILKFYYDYFTRSIQYPGPFPLPVVGNLHQYFYNRNDIPSWFYQLSLKYGDIFELYFGSNKHLMISNSRVVKRIMTKDSNYFVRVATRGGLDDLQKGNIGILFNADFHSWSHIRKIFIKVAGSPNALRVATNLVNNIFQDLEKLWNSLIEEQGQILNNEQEKSVEIDFISWAKRIFAETTMLLTASKQPNVLSAYYNKITNRDLDNIQSTNEEFLDHLFIASDCAQYYITVPPLIRNLPIINTYTNHLYKNLMWTRNYAYNLVKERRKEIERIDDKEKLTPDMLNMLLAANTPKDITQSSSNENNKKPMTDEEVGDNIIEIFSEGIDGPSNTLAFILYYVGSNPDVEQHILGEVEKVFDCRSDFKIAYEDLNRLVYVEAVIKEVLRVRPATATISRFLEHSDQIDKYKIPPSTQLVINVVGLHKNQKYWEKPTEFNPSKFLYSSSEDEIYDKNTFMNFGGGLRMCPGRHFAMTQLKMIIVLLYSKYKFEVITKDPLTQYNVNVQCKELKIRIKRRTKV